MSKIKFITYGITIIFIIGVLSPFENLLLKFLMLTIGISLLYWLGTIGEKEKNLRHEKEKTLGGLKTAYNELDEQAKIIVKTDLELNKTQEELDKRINGLYTLHELGKTINRIFDVNELFESISKDVVVKLGFEKCIVATIEPKPKKLIIRKQVGYSDGKLTKLHELIENSAVLKRTLVKNESLIYNRLTKEDKNVVELANNLKANSFCITPISLRDTAIGLLFMGSESPYSRVTESDLEIISIFATQISVAMENVNLYEQIWKSHQELEVRVKERTKELANANEELKKLDQMKSDFVSAVSHELRTPLTSIKGYASILYDGRLGKVNPEQCERLRRINKHSNNLAKLINDLLDISRIESGKVEMEMSEVLLKDILENVLDIIRPQTEEKKIVLSWNISDKPLVIYADSTHIERVFINILGNAVKFTPEKGKINITIEDNTSEVKVKISDTGSGIAAHDLSKIFDEFYRTDNPINRKEKGSGLGLSLVKRIIKVHKGEIWAESKIDKGTTFIFTLPKKAKYN